MISVFRIFLAPALVLLVLSKDDTAASIAAAVFVFGAFTDGLDGWLARRYSNSTTIGQWLDPLADKILVSAPLIAMSATGQFPVLATVIIVGRELAVSMLRARLGSRGISMPASPWAKAKTAVQMVLVPLYLLPLGDGAVSTRRVVLALAVALTIWSGLDYFLRTGRRTTSTEPR
jgi:CDP-diacylglycerol--glycerol-3-phosphate 3-phosphatidyltransferase